MIHMSQRPMNPPELIASCLSPCLALTEQGIPFVLWGEEALRFAYDVPTVFMSTVPAHSIQDALEAILARFPHYSRTYPDPNKFTWGTDSLRAFPLSVWLSAEALVDSAEPNTILLTPDSFLHFDALDTQCLRPLPSPPTPDYAPIRLPKLVAYFDAAISTHLEFFHGEREYEAQLHGHVSNIIAYLAIYTFRSDAQYLWPSVDSLPSSIRDVGERLKPRNQEYFFGRFISKPGEARAATPDEKKGFYDSSSDEDSDLAGSNEDGHMLVSENDIIRHDGGQKPLPEILKMQETPVQ